MNNTNRTSVKRFNGAPDVRKGSSYSECDYTYGQRKRPEIFNEVIRQQIADVRDKYLHTNVYVDDVNNPTKLLIPEFHLPSETRKLNNGLKTAPLIIMIPDRYPAMPPVGFFLPIYVKAGRHSGFSSGYHGAYKETVEYNGLQFRWYCSSILADTWQPAYLKRPEDWRHGDNLWHVLTLINEVLSDFSDD